MKRKVIKPNVVSGGVAIPLGENMYLMRGRKHKNGGIDIGNDPKTGIEVEDGEVMQMTNKGAKIFSAMPLLRGSSPANEVLSGANPNDVFRRQEAYKDRNGINDDGSKKKAIGGEISRRNAFRTAFGNNVGIYPIDVNDLSTYSSIPNNISEDERQKLRTKIIDDGFNFIRNDLSMAGIDHTKIKENRLYGPYEKNLNFRRNLYRARNIEENGYNIPDIITANESILSSDITRTIPYVNKNAIHYNPYGMKPDRFNNPEIDKPKIVSYITPEEAKTLRYNINKENTINSSSKFSKFFKNKDNVSDLIGVGSNILGSTLSYFRNKSMLKNMQAPIKPTIAAPVSYQQTKLKTNININPQLDTLRNSSAIYNNSVDNNTASSRVALARKQVNRMNINNQINSLYGNKENQETELINKDRMQQQQTANQNVAQYNDYLNRKAALDNEYNNQLINFKNTINEKKAENAVSLFSNANAAIQDILGRREQRTNERNTIAAYLASHPDVNPRLFERLGINGVFTPEMIEAWEEEYKNNKKKLKPKTE